MTDVKPRGNNAVKPSLVPPVVVALVSLIIPGLGHLLARAVQRGIILILTVLSLVGLLVWRINVVARREVELLEILKKAFRLEPVLLVATILIILIFILVALDAYRIASRMAKASFAPLILVLLVNHDTFA